MIILLLTVFTVIFTIIYLWIRVRLSTSQEEGIQPPHTNGGILDGIAFLRNPTAYLNAQRRALGDVFILRLFGLKLFFVFSRKGLAEFYSVPEESASFTEATRGFLGFKVPEEVMQGSMATISRVLQRDFQQLWGRVFAATVSEALDEMGDNGTIDIFKWAKIVAHKAGFRSWIGDEAAAPGVFEDLVSHFDNIDPEQGFTSMGSLVSTVLTRRSKERASLYHIRDILTRIHDSRSEKKDDFLEALFEEFQDLPPPERNLRVTCQVVAIHMASQSNLFAAIAWTVVNVARHEEAQRQVLGEIAAAQQKYGETAWLSSAAAMQGFDFLEKCFHESIRLAQQSLTLRLVLKPVTIEGYTVVPGYYIATLLSCLNQQDDLLQDAARFDPEKHYERGGRVKAEALAVGANYSISTFGYGPHQCPGKRFAILSCKVIVATLMSRFTLVPQFKECPIIPTQMGAVGRPINPATFVYSRKRE